MGACLEVALRKLIDCLAAGSGAGNVVRGEEVNRGALEAAWGRGSGGSLPRCPEHHHGRHGQMLNQPHVSLVP